MLPPKVRSGGEYPAHKPYKACEIISSCPAKVTAGGT